jgi:hypothetical protein
MPLVYASKQEISVLLLLRFMDISNMVTVTKVDIYVG